MTVNHIKSSAFFLSLIAIFSIEAKPLKSGFGKESFCSEIKMMKKNYITTSRDKIINIDKFDSNFEGNKKNRSLLLVKSINNRIPPELKLLNTQEIYQCTLNSQNCKFEKSLILETHRFPRKNFIEIKDKQKIFIDRIEIRAQIKIKSQDFVNFNKIYNLEITSPQKDVLSILLLTKIYLQDKKFKDIELKTKAEIVLLNYDKPQDLLKQELKIHLNSDKYKKKFEALIVKELAQYDLHICKKKPL